MTKSMSRRDALTAGATAAIGLSISAAASVAQTSTSSPAQAVEEETKSLETLYQDALTEGGNLIVYAGGDIASQQDAAKNAFLAQFPKMNLAMIVDYSKFHDVRIDNQFATNTLVPDVVQLQTLQNFTRWNQQGRLLQYKPAGFSKVYEKFKDPDGAWLAIGILAFSSMYDVAAAGNDAPTTPRDLVNPQWQDCIFISQRRRRRSIPLQTLCGSLWLGLDCDAGGPEPTVCSRVLQSSCRCRLSSKDHRDRWLWLPDNTLNSADQVGGCRRSTVRRLGPARRDPQRRKAHRSGQTLHELADFGGAPAVRVQRMVSTD